MTSQNENSNGTYAPEHDEEWFREQYIERRRSAADIGEEIGLSDRGVLNRLEEYGIERREHGRIPELQDKDRLARLYWDDGLTLSEIADRIGCHKKSVRNAFNHFNIKRRTPGEYNGGPDHDAE